MFPGLQLGTQAGDGVQARLHREALYGAVHTPDEVTSQQFSVSVSVRLSKYCTAQTKPQKYIRLLKMADS